MANRLQGKTALVTAAGQGIGRAAAVAMAREGAVVMATDVDASKLEGLQAEGVSSVHQLDVTDAGAVAALAADLDGVTVLFNCAGFVHHGTILDCDEDAWDFSFNLNVKSMYRMMRTFIPGMVEAGGGSIINMSSVASSIRGAPNRFVYGATKAAVIGMTKAVAADFAGKSIRCNAICPGTVETPSLGERIAAFDDPEEARKAFIARQPLGRLAAADEIAMLVVYLASDESGFTTGACEVIDGGWSV